MRADALRSATRRIAVMRALVVLLFLGLAARAAHLTVIDPRGDRRHDVQVNTTLALTGARGAILDRDGRALAVTVPSPSIYVLASDLDPSEIPALANALGMRTRDLAKRLAGRSGFTYLARWVEPERAERVAALGLAAVGQIDEARRRYPAGRLAGPILGFADFDGKGVRGIEQQEDEWLRGTERRVDVQRDGRGRLLALDAVDPFATGGGEVRLTLDLTAQAAAETALREAVERTGARGGIAISLIPQTGEIVALAEAPGFDPNGFRKLDYARTGSSAFLEAVEPGSTLKIFVAAAALEAGAVDESDLFDCSGGRLALAGGGRVRDRRDFGVLGVSDVLRLSSNIGSALLGQALGRRAHYEALRRFGFGERTGRGDAAFPSESAGLLRPWQDWRPIDHATVSFGQGISVTAVQLAAATAALANRGSWVQPTLVAARRRPDAPWQAAAAPERRRAVRPDTAARMLAMLESVVGEDGTGRLAALRGLRVAGKTGTAQKFDRQAGRYSKDRYIAWFVGIAPADDPKLVIVTALDEPKTSHSGGVVAAPLFAEIASRQLAHYGIATEALHGPGSLPDLGAIADSAGTGDGDETPAATLAEPAPAAPAVAGLAPEPTAPAREALEVPSVVAKANASELPAPREQRTLAANATAILEAAEPTPSSRSARRPEAALAAEGPERPSTRSFVPELVGMTLVEARRVALANALELEVSADFALETIAAADRSSAQWPVPGTILAEGERRVIVRFERHAGSAARRLAQRPRGAR